MVECAVQASEDLRKTEAQQKASEALRARAQRMRNKHRAADFLAKADLEMASALSTYIAQKQARIPLQTQIHTHHMLEGCHDLSNVRTHARDHTCLCACM